MLRIFKKIEVSPKHQSECMANVSENETKSRIYYHCLTTRNKVRTNQIKIRYEGHLLMFNLSLESHPKLYTIEMNFMMTYY